MRQLGRRRGGDIRVPVGGCELIVLRLGLVRTVHSVFSQSSSVPSGSCAVRANSSTDSSSPSGSNSKHDSLLVPYCLASRVVIRTRAC